MNQKAENHFLTVTPDCVGSELERVLGQHRVAAVPAAPLPARGLHPAMWQSKGNRTNFFLFFFFPFFLFYNKGGGRGEISEFLLGASHSACNVM